MEYEEIEYRGRKILPIMKPMLVWDDDETEAEEAFVYGKEEESIYTYPWISKGEEWWSDTGVRGWKHAKPIPEIVELTLQDISEGKGVGVPAHLIKIKE
jgi:hypothetical protein